MLNIFTLPLDHDSSWVQVLTGIHFLLAFLMTLKNRHSSLVWTLFSIFLAFLCADEFLMIHEYFKFTYNFHNKVFADFFVFLYGVLSCIGAIIFLKKYTLVKGQKLVMFFMFILMCTVVANDVFNISFFYMKNAAEECCELLISASMIVFIKWFDFKRSDSIENSSMLPTDP